MAETFPFNELNDLLCRELAARESVTCRLFHGRGGLVPPLKGITVDRFGPLLYVIIHDNSTGCDLKEALFSSLMDLTRESNLPVCELFIQDRTHRPDITWKTTLKDQDTRISDENGLLYHINPFAGQNPGLFTDASHIRAWLRKQSSGKRVLNLFAYTCSFSVAALAGGAVQVDNWDMNRQALSRGRENHRLNNLPCRGQRVTYEGHNILKSAGRITKNGPYDLVILDPPSYQGKSFHDEKHLRGLIRRLPEWQSSRGKVIVNVHNRSKGLLWVKELFVDIPYEFACRLESPIEKWEGHPDKGLKTLLFLRRAGSP